MQPTPRGASASAGTLIDGRYRVVRLLGQGGMGAVYLVQDLRQGEVEKALKVVERGRLNRRMLAALRNEFLTVAALRHPNLAAVYDFGVDLASGDLYLTSEFIAGTDWGAVVQGLDLRRPQPLHAFLDLAVQVLRALEYIHSRAMVHGDIKPANVLVTAVRPLQAPQAPQGEVRQVKMIDFGLTRREREFGGKKVLGTPYYVAPEAILGTRIDRRADLYSLGAVLYQLATGQPPFAGETALDILKAHVEIPPPDPLHRRPDMSPHLAAIILRLLAKEPNERYRSAVEVIDAINRAFALDFPFETLETMASYLHGSRLIGREREQKALAGAIALVRQAEGDADTAGKGAAGRPRSALGDDADEVGEGGPPMRSDRCFVLSGESGLGKHWLVEELRYLTQAHQARWLSLTCSSGENGAGLAGLLDLLRALPGIEAALSAVAEQVELAGRRRSVRRPDSRAGGLTSALKDLTAALLAESARIPTVLCLEHVECASSEIVAFLRGLLELLAAERVQENRLIVIATLEENDDDESCPFHRLRDDSVFLRQVVELPLERLSREETAQIVGSAFRGCELPAGFTDRIYEESDGVQELILDTLRCFMTRGKIHRLRSGWSIAPDFAAVPLPGGVRQALRAKISSLPEEALRLAAAFAFLERPCEADLAGRLADLQPKLIGRSLELLRRKRLLRQTGFEDHRRLFAINGHSARAVLYETTPRERRRWLHERAALLCEEHCQALKTQRPVELAHQFLRAGLREKAIQYHREAARQLRAAGDFREAIRCFEAVLDLAPAKDAALHAEARRDAAALKFELGDYGDVVRLLEPIVGAKDSALDAEARTEAAVLTARSLARLGGFSRAGKLLLAQSDPTLAALSPALRAAVYLAQAELHALRGNPVASLQVCERLTGTSADSADGPTRVQAYLLLAENHSALNNRAAAASFCQAALRMLRGQDNPAGLAQALVCKASYYCHRERYTLAVKHFRLALHWLQALDRSAGQADCLFKLGSVQVRLGQYDSAASALQEAVDLYARCACQPSLAAARCALAEVRAFQGEAIESRRLGAAALESPGLDGAACLRAKGLRTEAQLLLDLGDLEGAEQRLEESRRGRGPQLLSAGEEVQELDIASRLAHHRGAPGEALRLSATALLRVRETADQLGFARLLRQRVLLLVESGSLAEARREAVQLLEVSRRHSLRLEEGWARLLEASIDAREGRNESAGRLLALAAQQLLDVASERDLVHLYLEQGLLSLRRGNHEQAYLDLEEGLYSTKKLSLDYYQCRYRLALGAFEAESPKGAVERAVRLFQLALRQAERAPYRELVWQAHHRLAVLLPRAGEGEGHEHLRAACAALRAILADVPAHLRPGYLRVSGGEALLVAAQELVRESEVCATSA
jgi:serine/threonine-protein kinase